MKIIAIIVTYNRLMLLKKCIRGLHAQSIKLDEIIVVNNDSTDGTEDWLISQEDITVIKQENVGGAGGFYTGIKTAYEHHADWIWAMDDDVFPSDKCLENLLKCNNDETGILCPKRIINGRSQICFGETIKFNLQNPFFPLKKELSSNILNDSPVEIEGMSFEGPLINAKIINNVGYPNKDLFIFWDDSDFSFRTVAAGYKVRYIPTAILFKELIIQESSNKKNWKAPYGLRNEVYFTRKYAKNIFFRNIYPMLIILRYELGVIKHLLLGTGKYSVKDFRIYLKAFKDGYNFNLGKY